MVVKSLEPYDGLWACVNVKDLRVQCYILCYRPRPVPYIACKIYSVASSTHNLYRYIAGVLVSTYVGCEALAFDYAISCESAGRTVTTIVSGMSPLFCQIN